MRRRYSIPLVVIAIAVAHLFGGAIPAVIVGALGVAFIVAQLFGWNPSAALGATAYDRTRAGISAVWLAGIGILYHNFLVANWSDNAYLWLVLIGDAFFLLGILFAAATLLPVRTVQRPLYWLGIGALWVLGVVATAMLLYALVIIPFQGYSGRQVFISHLLGLFSLLPSLYLVGYLLPRRRAGSEPEASPLLTSE